MKYLRSTTTKAYTFNGQTIPSYKGEPLALTDPAYNNLLKNVVVKSLVNAGAIFVTDKAPTNPTAQVKDLSSKNAQLILENTRLQEELAKAKSGATADEEAVKAAVEKQKAEDEAAVASIVSDKEKEIELLKAQLEAAKAAAKSAAAAADKVAEEQAGE